jgi:transcriptional regulator with GAF, ATPase, and Fis domain
MADESASATTEVHRGPAQPTGPAGRAALVCGFPRSVAVAMPDSGAIIGRSWLAERGLADKQVSGEHLRVDRRGGGLKVVDLGSRNGTWVNGHPIEAQQAIPLEDGDVLRLGRTLFVVRERLVGSLEPAAPLGDLVGPYGLRAVASELEGLARQKPSNVLIEGETGSGKELCARAIAAALGREHLYAPVNVAGMAAGVFESQLFGHVAGAFSGSTGRSDGIVLAHDGGTVFLDEIGELPMDLQAKLLRLLDNREVLPVGADRPVHVDVLLLAATNRSLETMVEEGRFRSDLYARLSMAAVELPPLRERVEDILPIACALAERSGGALESDDVEVEAVERLMLRVWPRNVRELRSVVEAANRVDPEPGLRLWALDQVLGDEEPDAPKRQALTDALVEATIEECGGNVTAAARRLGVSRGKLIRFRKKRS